MKINRSLYNSVLKVNQINQLEDSRCLRCQGCIYSQMFTLDDFIGYVKTTDTLNTGGMN